MPSNLTFKNKKIQITLQFFFKIINQRLQIMNKYILLFRGINVSGHKIIKMADLKSHLESIGLIECYYIYSIWECDF